MLIMTGIPPQHDIMKHTMTFHNSPSPEASCSSNRKRKQELQYTSENPLDIYGRNPTTALGERANFSIPVEPLISRSTPPNFHTFLQDSSSVGENQALMMVDLGSQTRLLPSEFNWQENMSPVPSPTRYPSPAFFTPGFLDSLQENEVYTHPLNIEWEDPQPYQPMPTKSQPKEWEAESMGVPRSLAQARRSPHHAKMKPWIQTYLAHSVNEEAAHRLGEKTVIVLSSKVAQKSYGTEKRFLCPPPTAILVGTSWWTALERPEEETTEVLRVSGLMGKDLLLGPPKLSISISGEGSSQIGSLEWYTVTGDTVGQTGHKLLHPKEPALAATPSSSSTTRFRSSESRHPPVDLYHNQHNQPLAAGKSVQKHLFINDADEKRKRVECLIKLKLANGLQMSTIASKQIKVISKPSKKRQSVKNMELCIHHGTTVSLFNRIRSQTVSTKYLGVSTKTPLSFPGIEKETKTSEGTCFVARMNSWDPFVIWIVDPSSPQETDPSLYPPPPAIALKNKTGEPVPIHYNQPVVLQCLTTGLVSPVMVIRKVDRASTVVGGAQEETGEEVLGDPVSQLHKIALQIVQDPGECAHTYLACLNDIVGMHKTTLARKPVHKVWDESGFDVITSQEGGKVVRKRRVSMDPHPPESLMSSMSLSDPPTLDPYRRHEESDLSRKSSLSSSASSTPSLARRSSSASTMMNQLGAFWTEDVSDAAVWTIVGTDCATYTFWSPQLIETPQATLSSNPLPSLSHYFSSTSNHETLLTLHGENFSRDLEIWFGDIKAVYTEYRSRELLICQLPSRLDLQQVQKHHGQIPILLVRADSTICKSGQYFHL
ncbi:hypothetical protein BY458DRAFT_543572 [Sporodiniella umbellata]|nr:hypothetical protein BY458DRAFT_543572 [Sporodiniella umbellata]